MNLGNVIKCETCSLVIQKMMLDFFLLCDAKIILSSRVNQIYVTLFHMSFICHSFCYHNSLLILIGDVICVYTW